MNEQTTTLESAPFAAALSTPASIAGLDTAMAQGITAPENRRVNTLNIGR